MIAELTGLLGIFIAGALPWLEAVIVIPAGIVAGLNPVAVVIAGLSGNLLTIVLAAVYGQKIRQWWRNRKRRGRADAADDSANDPQPTSRARRAQRVMERWGMPGLALLGPIGLGTQLSAVLAVSMGVNARVTSLWVGAGTAAWSITAAILASAGLSFLGIGA